MTHRIALIHATRVSLDPVEDAFNRLWSDAEHHHLLDESLTADLAKEGALTPEMDERFMRLATYAVDTGADAVLFTCSAFGTCIEKVKAALPVPVLKPNEAMIDEALQAGSRIALLATADVSIRSMAPEFEAAAAAAGRRLELTGESVPEAMSALRRGDVEAHDALVVERANSTTACDALVLTQFSMASAKPKIADVQGRPVFTTPESAVLKMKSLLRAGPPDGADA